LCERLIASLSGPIAIDGQEVCVGLSIGVAIAPGDGGDEGTLLRHADIALYQAKADGRSAFRFFAPQMNERLQSRRALELDLRRAVDRDELLLHFQPRFETTSLRPAGLEALLRWSRAGGATAGPEHFVPLAEETGLIVPIGDWVLREACRQAASLSGLTVSANLSPVQFRRGDLVASVEEALSASDLDPRRLELEITEGVLLDSSDAALRVLHRLKRLGIRLALDDFGTGYSSLSYLQSFPFDRVKIDRRFVGRLGRSAEALAIVRAVLDLARGLGMATTAEGVEREEQLSLLREAGCEEVQGFLLGRPAPLSQLDLAEAARARPGPVLRLVAADGR
jgi:EAL domain-containing protein (putative c-di-GMP-specific phosphodiesterase class I)